MEIWYAIRGEWKERKKPFIYSLIHSFACWFIPRFGIMDQVNWSLHYSRALVPRYRGMGMSLVSYIALQLYATCWLNERHLLIGGSQKHTAAVIDVQTDKVNRNICTHLSFPTSLSLPPPPLCLLPYPQIVSDLKDLTAGVYSVHHNPLTKHIAVASGSKIHICSSHFFLNKTPPPFTPEWGCNPITKK